MKNSINLIPNTLLNWHLKSFSQHESKLITLYKTLDLTPSLLQHKGAIIEASQFADLVKKSIELFNDESFTSLNIPLQQGTFAMMTHACITSVTLENALKRMTKYYTIVSNELAWSIEVDKEHIHVIFDLPNNSKTSSNFFSAFMMSSVWRWLCWMIAKPIFLEKVEFSFNSPTVDNELKQVFNSPVLFNQEHNKLTFSKVYLQQPVMQSSSTLLKFLQLIPENLFSHYKTNLCIKNQVQEHLEAQNSIQKSDLQSVAKTFFCSEQTLMRRLKKEGTSFKEIKDKACRNKAFNYLKQTNETIEKISFKLGFIDASTFYKKFKSWTQQTPNQYRKANQNNYSI